MKLSAKIDVHHLTRVEGHGNILIRIENGKLKQARWEVVETPRFFEAMLVGKSWENAPWLVGRICGICSIGHTLASIRAIERGFGLKPSKQTEKLRLLLKHAETLQSHVLHLMFLVAPDFVGENSVIPLMESDPDLVARAAGLKLLANDLADLIGGRRLHPTTTVVGGFTKVPDKSSLEAFVPRLKTAIRDLELTADLFGTFKIPDFVRETEFVSLGSKDSYPFIGGNLVSTDGVRKKEDEYLEMTNEYMVTQSTSKWSRLSRESFAVGALARLNNNYDLLHPKARAAAKKLGLAPVNHNPFMNNVAQLVECFHVVHELLELVDDLLATPWELSRKPVTPKAGRGVGAVEVPRGILYHCYEFDKKGIITGCDCVIPTSQNHANIDHDIRALARSFSLNGASDAAIELTASMLVRAYDPCISCSVH